jgi:hypothetical protein
MVAHAFLAGELGDERYVRMLVSKAELGNALLDRAIEQFSATTELNETADLVESVRSDLALVDLAPEKREAFMGTKELDDAIAYARCLVVNHIDLQLELDDVLGRSEPLGAALDIAAEANSRRCLAEAALGDAIEALSVWPGAIRSSAIAAQARLDVGDNNGALRIIADVRAAGDGASAMRRDRVRLGTVALRAHLGVHDLPRAVREAADILDNGGSIEDWELLLHEAEGDMHALTLVLGLALTTDGIDFIDALARSIAPTRTAEICGTYLGLGGTNPDAVSTGLLASVLAGQEELGLVIAQYGSVLPDELRARLAQHLSDSGAPTLAFTLMAEQSARLVS